MQGCRPARSEDAALWQVGCDSSERGSSRRAGATETRNEKLAIGLRQCQDRSPQGRAPRERLRKDRELRNDLGKDNPLAAWNQLVEANRAAEREVPLANGDRLLKVGDRR